MSSKIIIGCIQHSLANVKCSRQGDITTLEVDAITNTTDETLLECNAVSERVMFAAGAGLKEEILTRALG